jgi:hypothetical protein
MQDLRIGVNVPCFRQNTHFADALPFYRAPDKVLVNERTQKFLPCGFGLPFGELNYLEYLTV